MKIKRSICPELKGKKAYNPNTYTKLDAGVAFLGFTLFFYGFYFLFKQIIKGTAFLDFLRAHASFNLIFSTCLAQFLVFIFAFVYGKIRRVGFLTGGGYSFRWNTVHMLMGIMLCLGILFVFESVHMQLADDFEFLFGSGAGSYPDNISAGWLIFDALVLTTLLPAICEEALMRGIIFRALEGYGKIFAIVCSGAIFAIFHENTSQIILQFLGGMAFGLALCATKNFFISCSMHFLYNLLVTLSGTYLAVLEDQYYYAFVWCEAISILLGIVFIIVSLTYFIKLCMATEKKTENKDIKSGYRVYLYSTKENAVTELYAGKTQLIKARIYGENDLFLHGRYFVKANKSDKRILPIVFLTLSIIVGIAFIFI